MIKIPLITIAIVAMCLACNASKGADRGVELTGIAKLISSQKEPIDDLCEVSPGRLAVASGGEIAFVDLLGVKPFKSVRCPQGTSCLAYDAEDNSLWVGGAEGGLYHLILDSMTLNTVIDTSRRIGGPALAGLCLAPRKTILYANDDKGFVNLRTPFETVRIAVKGTSVRFAGLSMDRKTYYVVTAGSTTETYDRGFLSAIDLESRAVKFTVTLSEALSLSGNSSGDVLVSCASGIKQYDGTDGHLVDRISFPGSRLDTRNNSSSNAERNQLAVAASQKIYIVDANQPKKILHSLNIQNFNADMIYKVFFVGEGQVVWTSNNKRYELYCFRKQ